MTYDMTLYQQQALRTEAPADEACKQRLLKAYYSLDDILLETAGIGYEVDRLKRHIYYGKVDEDLTDNFLPTHPVGEKAERIKQMVRILHGFLGATGEVGELSEPILAYITEGGELNATAIKEECHDLLWYINLILSTVGSSIPEVCEAGIAKLKVRFPDKFSGEQALDERNKDKELASFQARPDPDYSDPVYDE